MTISVNISEGICGDAGSFLLVSAKKDLLPQKYLPQEVLLFHCPYGNCFFYGSVTADQLPKL